MHRQESNIRHYTPSVTRKSSRTGFRRGTFYKLSPQPPNTSPEYTQQVGLQGPRS